MADSTRIQMGVRAVSVVTVSLDDTLSISGKAADAKAVGDALAGKADIDTLMNNVTITVDGAESDNQGVILLYGEDIPVDDSNNAPTVADKLAAIDAKTAADINYATGTTIKAKIDAVAGDLSTVEGNMTADKIPMSSSDATKIATAISTITGNMYADQIAMGSSDATKISAAISAVDGKKASDIVYASGSNDKITDVVGAISTRVTTVEGKYVSKDAQTLQPGEQTQIQTNLGLGDAATKTVKNDLNADTAGYVLDARQGAALNTAIGTVSTNLTNLNNKWTKQDITSQITYGNLDTDNKATIQQGSLHVYKIGSLCHLEFGLKFGTSQSSNSQAWKGDFYGLPTPLGALRGIGGTVTYSAFSYTLSTSGACTVRFLHLGTTAGTTNTYTICIEYMIDESSGGDDGGDDNS